MKHLLLLHGALGSARQLEPLAVELSARYQLHAITFSGHGNKEIPAEGYTFDVFMNDILGYMDKEGLDSVDVFGYSMGGYAAMYTALRHPGRIGKIATLGTKLMWTEADAQKEVKMLDAEKIRHKVPAFAAHLENIHGLAWPEVLKATADMMLALGENPALTEADYRNLKHETLLILGDQDYTAKLSDTLQVFSYLTNARLWVMPGTPHPFEKVDVQVLADGLRRFFG